MHAVMIEPDRRLVWREVPDPLPGADDVLVEIHATALNRADLLQREGNYPPPPGWPQWPGLEAAGVVRQAPEGSRWKPGDAVCALLGGGGYAEQVCVPSGMLLPIPGGLSMAEAASLPEVFATAYLNLCREAGMKSGDTVFIQAGASGLGTAAIQLAKRRGATVVTTVGSEEKASLVRSLGADVVVNHTSGDLVSVLKSHPVDIALDCVAGANLGPCLEQMAPGGRWVVIATLGGPKSDLDMNVFFRKGLKLIGSTLRSRSPQAKAEILAALEAEVWGLIADGSIRPVLHRVLPIAEAEEAHAILQRKENLGKVILQVQG